MVVELVESEPDIFRGVEAIFDAGVWGRRGGGGSDGGNAKPRRPVDVCLPDELGLPTDEGGPEKMDTYVSSYKVP